MPQSVTLADEFVLPDAAQEGSGASAVDVAQEFEPPPARQTEAITVDAHQKIADWNAAFRNTDSPEAGFDLVKKWAGEKAADSFKKNAASFAAEATTPLLHAPRANVPAENDLPASMRPMHGAASVVAGAYNSAAGFGESMVTPFNIATLGTFGALTRLASGVGRGAKAAQGALSAIKVAFGAEMAKAAGEQAGKASVDLADPNKSLQEKVETGLAPLITGGMAILSAHSGVVDAMEVTAPRARATNPNAVNEVIAGAPEKAPVEISDTNTIVPTPGPEASRLQATKGGQEKLTAIQDALKSPDTVIQYSVWDREMLPPGADRTAQVDIINPESAANERGGVASTNRALLQELGVDVPPAPESLPPGRYTLDQIKEAIAKEANLEPKVETKTAKELVADILEKNPNADVTAPEQLLGEGNYQLADVPVDRIGPVFGESTIQKKVVAKYMTNPPSDPIVLARVDGELRPVDGKHRLTAKQMSGEETIHAWVPVDDPIIAKTRPKPKLEAEFTPPSNVSPDALEVGLGAASPAEFRPVQEFTTSMKNAVMDMEATARGQEPAMATAKKTFGDTWDEAMRRIDENQNVADELIADLKEKSRPIKDVETAILAHRKIELQNAFNKATRNIAEGRGTPDSIAADKIARQVALDELLDLSRVNRESGSELGRGLNIRKAQAAEDFSLTTMLEKRSVALGDRKLTPEEVAQVEAQHARIKELEEAAKNEGGTERESNIRKAKADKAKDDFDESLERDVVQRMTGTERLRHEAVSTYDAARNLMTTGEFSFILRQGKLATAAHPILAAKAFPKAVQALFADEVTARAIDMEVLNHPDAPSAIEAGLHLTEAGERLSAREETMASKLADKIPVLGNFNQAGRVFLNKLRFDVYQSLKEARPEMTPEQNKALASFVNNATGRGSLGGLERAAVPLGRLLFAPRYLSSRIQFLVGRDMWGGDLTTRRIIAKEYAKTLIGLGAYYSALKLGFDSLTDDEKKKTSIETDPRSSDFGKVKIGNTRLDPLAGLSQVIVFGARSQLGSTKTASGKVVPIRGDVPYGGRNWMDVASSFARSKLHPLPGSIVNLYSGTDLGGNPATIGNQAVNFVTPMTYMDIYEALEEQDLPQGVSFSLLALLGEGLQTYDAKAKRAPKAKREMGAPAP